MQFSIRFLIFFLFISHFLFPQSFNINKKKKVLDKDEFKSCRVTCITQDDKKHLWISTYGDYLFEYNGFEYIQYKNVNHKNLRTVFIDSQNRIWAGGQGGITIIDKNKVYSFKEYFHIDFLDDVTQIFQKNSTEFYITTTKGIYFFSKNKLDFLNEKLRMEFGINKIVKFGNYFVIATRHEGISVFNDKNELVLNQFNYRNKYNYTNRFTDVEIKDSLFYFSSEKGMLVCKFNLQENHFEIVDKIQLGETYALKIIDNDVFIAGNLGLLKYSLIDKKVVSINSKLKVKCFYLDNFSNLFLGSNEFEGLFIIPKFSYSTLMPIYDVCDESEYRKIKLFLSTKSIYQVHPNDSISLFYKIENGQQEIDFSCCTVFNDNLLLGTSNSGIYLYHNNKITNLNSFQTNAVSKKNNIGKKIIDLKIVDDTLVAFAPNRIYKFDRDLNFVSLQNINLLLNEKYVSPVNSVFQFDNNKFIFSTGKGVNTFINSKEVRIDKDYFGGDSLSFYFTLIDKNKNYWYSSESSIYAKFKNENKVKNLSKYFDNEIIASYGISKTNMIFIGKFHVYVLPNNLNSINQSNIYKLRKRDLCDFDFVNREVIYEDGDDVFYIYTKNGIVKFDSKLVSNKYDSNFNINILSVTVDNELKDKENIFLDNTFKDLKIKFEAIDYQKQENVSFKYRLLPFEKKWSNSLSQNFILFSSLPYGVYEFQVKASNDEVFWTKPAILKFTIDKPFYLKFWFLSLFIFLLTMSIYLIIRYKQIKLKKFNTFLKNQVDLKTNQIVAEKEKIESLHFELSSKNDLIMSSIKYAEKIQRNYLPEESSFSKCFEDSFILFRPKSVVSGDFYWLCENDNYIFVSVADCTGHGIPAALLTISGITILNQVVEDNPDANSATILNHLNVLFSNKNNNSEYDISDGMDIVLIRINVITRQIDFASAGGSFIGIDNENNFTVFKGDYKSLGDDTNFKYECKNIGSNLKKIYLYSDGYKDQKLKDMRRLSFNDFTDKIVSNSNEKFTLQKQMLNTQLNSSMQDLPQTDDITIVGIKLNS